MGSKYTRRRFIKNASALGAALASTAQWPRTGNAVRRYGPGNFGIIVTHDNATSGDYPNQQVVQLMVNEGIRRWTGISSIGEAWESIFTRGINATTKICIKINCIDRCYTTYTNGSRVGVASSPEIVNAIVLGLTRMLGGAYPATNVTVYDDRGETRMRQAHFNAGAMPYPYAIQYTRTHSKSIFVYNTNEMVNDVVDQSHYLINVPLIKDHNISGATFSMKNHYGSVNAPGNMHGSGCRPYLPVLQLAQWTDSYARLTSFHDKTAAIIVDALYGLYNGGPTGGPRFVDNSILIANDTVAVDAKCLDILNAVRAAQNPPLSPRNCPWIADAETAGLGSVGLPWETLDTPSSIEKWREY